MVFIDDEDTNIKEEIIKKLLEKLEKDEKFSKNVEADENLTVV